jgi:signal peptidase I
LTSSAGKDFMEIEPTPSALPEIKPYRRKIWVTVLLNLFNPGLPLIYNGNLRGGILIVLLFLLLPIILYPLGGLSFIALLIVVPIQMVIWIGILIFNIKYTSKSNRFSFPRLRRAWSWMLFVLILSYSLGYFEHVLINHYFVEAYTMKAGSMANTLLKGDYLIASKNVDMANLHRGNLIIFKFPGDTQQNYVKRIAGLAGDRIKIVDKQLFVNDIMVPLISEGIFSDSNHVHPHTDEK